MSTPREEQGVRPEDTQFGEFFDFNKATEPQLDGTALDSLNLQGQDDYQPEEYARFQDWIPRFVKPDEPCGYCRSRHLQCYLSYGKLTCTACDTLFRSCSFANVGSQGSHTHDHVPSGMGLLDTLHPVTEDVTQEQGALTGTRVLKSRATIAEDKKSNPRFSRAAVKVLKDWVEVHSDNPYPTEDEKAELGRLTGLRYGQINTWLANARRRGKVGRGRTKGTSSPGIRNASPIGIPSSGVEIMNWENMNPLERWKHSPPTNEPAPISYILDAIDRNELPRLDAGSPSTLGYTGHGSSRERSGTMSNSNRRAPSMTSLEQLSSHSAVSSSAAWSGSHESFGSFSSFGSGLLGKRERRRRRKVPQGLIKKPIDKVKRVFQCTFCTDTFKSKYDWTRHEKTLHLSLEKFICCPLGPVTTDPVTGEKICAYCLSTDPSREHLETHGHQACVEKGLEARTFYRKDHLRQHLRLMHDSQLLPHMEAWKVEAKWINSRCGFCTQRFDAWQDRVDHIAAHFKDGRKMSEWKGCRGLDPGVAATVLNAMPPYLIGMEQTSPNPFSASCPKRCMTVSSHLQSGGPPATCWEILTVRLGCFAKQQTDSGVALTDEIIQHQARMILYDDPDPWNQTAADNPEWLDLFKRAHGLDYIPDSIGGKGKNVPEDLELYGDLGMRIPFCVQLQNGATEDMPVMTETLINEARAHRAQGQRGSSSSSLRDEADAAPVRTHQPYSSLAVPVDRAVQFESITGPYPESGVRGLVQNTKDLPSVTDLSCDQMLALLGEYTPEGEQASTAAGSSSASMSKSMAATTPYTVASTNSGPSSSAQHALDNLNASLAAATTANTDANAELCCTLGDVNCSHKDHLLMHLGFAPDTAATAPGTRGVAGGCAILHYTPESFPNPACFSGTSAPMTPDGGSGLQAINYAVTNAVFFDDSNASTPPVGMQDVRMLDGEGDFDFNDLSFGNDASLGDVDLDVDFGAFDPQMMQDFDAAGL